MRESAKQTTNDPILRGPIERPPGEAEIIRQVRERAKQRKKELEQRG